MEHTSLDIDALRSQQSPKYYAALVIQLAKDPYDKDHRQRDSATGGLLASLRAHFLHSELAAEWRTNNAWPLRFCDTQEDRLRRLLTGGQAHAVICSAPGIGWPSRRGELSLEELEKMVMVRVADHTY